MTNQEERKLRKRRGRRKLYVRKKRIKEREKAWIENGTKARPGHSVKLKT